jgi:hypothetical protein
MPTYGIVGSTDETLSCSFRTAPFSAVSVVGRRGALRAAGDVKNRNLHQRLHLRKLCFPMFLVEEPVFVLIVCIFPMNESQLLACDAVFPHWVIVVGRTETQVIEFFVILRSRDLGGSC